MFLRRLGVLYSVIFRGLGGFGGERLSGDLGDVSLGVVY